MIKKITTLFLILQLGNLFFFKLPLSVNTASLNSASATLSNSRMSYRAGIAGQPTVGSTTITIKTTGNEADINTKNLFSNDIVCFIDTIESGCKGNRIYTVTSILNDSQFTITPALATSLESTNHVVVIQSGNLTVNFTTGTEIPINGNIIMTVPNVNISGKTNDGIPDTNSNIASNGFDLNHINSNDISITGCSNFDWNSNKTITPGTASSFHNIIFYRQNSSCPAGSVITITIDSSPGIVNPAPIIDLTDQKAVNIYTINIKTRGSSNNIIDEVDVKLTPNKGVIVKADVEETLSLIVNGVNTNDKTCGFYPDIGSTATSIPFGTILSPNSFTNLSQKLTVSTNSYDGYKVTIEENDQMGRNGNICPGILPSLDEFTFGPNVCIRDSVCDQELCTERLKNDWVNPDNNGLGYSLENSKGNDAYFQYNSISNQCKNNSANQFCAREIPDIEGGKDKQIIMTNNKPVNESSIYICYRLSVSEKQPAGFYYNKVIYTAIPTF